jgi:soluble lytic murein transglycosylase
LTPLNSQNLYRNGRSHHLSKENAAAIAAYQTVLSQFPNSADAPLTRRRWAEITDAQTAITLLQPLAASQIPDAAEALLSLSQIYTKLNSPQSAQAVRQELWKRFPQSDAAAAAAWQIAWQQAQAGNLSAAISVAQTIGSAQQDTDIGSQLLYWAGKWQAQQGSTQAAQQTYRQVIEQFPHTYYAWRSAVQLGWPVGDFTSGRLPIQVQFTPAIQALPAVSEAVQTLHLAGLPRAAWERWQWEIDTTDPDLPTEQAFATGVLRNAAGDHLKGINQVAKLRFLEDPSVAGLRQRTDFWQAIYPLHYHDNANNLAGGDPFTQAGMAQWAKKFNLNALLVASLIRQESRFEPEIVSSSGALGLMQVMPSTGKWIADQLGISQYQLTKPADNLYLGSWYLDYTHRTYNNNSLLAVASYNAGPGNVAKWVKNYSLQDPDVFVEQIPFSETRGYVKAVFGNYWNYWQLYTVEGETLVSQSLQR